MRVPARPVCSATLTNACRACDSVPDAAPIAPDEVTAGNEMETRPDTNPSAPLCSADGAPVSRPKVSDEAVTPCGTVGTPASVAGNSPVSSRAVAPAGIDNSVSEVPNRPFAADSQITTETVSPTAILRSGGGRYFL